MNPLVAGPAQLRSGGQAVLGTLPCSAQAGSVRAKLSGLIRKPRKAPLMVFWHSMSDCVGGFVFTLLSWSLLMPVPFAADRACAGQPSLPADLLWTGLSGLLAGELVTTNFVPWRSVVLWHLFSPRWGVLLAEKDHGSAMLELCLPGQLGREVPCLRSGSVHGNWWLGYPVFSVFLCGRDFQQGSNSCAVS